MQTKTYSRMTEERLIEKFKKEFFSKTGKKLCVEGYSPTDLPYPVISLYDLQSICEELLPEGNKGGLKRKTRYLDWVYPRMIFCHIAYSMDYSIKNISEFLELDRTTIYNAISTIDKLLSTNYLPVSNLFKKVVNKINESHYGTTIPTMSEISDKPESALSTALL